MRDGMVVDFAVNRVCAIGTGSFLNQQGLRLKMRIEDFGEQALQSRNLVHVEGQCIVFAESYMRHRHQIGFCRPC